jgi:hypothetical protein
VVFITNSGELIVDANRWKRRLESFLSWCRAVEDALGSALPGQHKGIGAFIADHSADGYLRAVQFWDVTNRRRHRSHDDAAP